MDLPSIVISIAILCTMFYAGLLFDMKFLNKILHKEPLTHLAALSCINFFLVPLIGFIIIESIGIEGALAIAIMTIAVFPCAPVVPSIVGSLEGDSSWAILVLVLFTLLSLPATIVYYLSSGDLHNGSIASSPIFGLCRYLLVVYPPIMAGIVCSKLMPADSLSIIKYAKIVMNLSLLSVVIIFSVLHFNELLTVSIADIVYLLLFITISSMGVLLVGKSELGNFSTSLFSTGMRNIALAISFCTLVLQRSDISMYLFVYIVLAGIYCTSISFLRKRYFQFGELS